MSRPLADVFRVADRAFFPDPWRGLAPGEAVPAEGHVIVPLPRWRAERDVLAGSVMPLGLRLEPGDDPEAIAPDFGRFALVAVAFPSFTDGRGYSTARLLREHLGFRGEMRAIGDVLLDQIPFMMRCGFDSLVIAHAATRRALERGHLPQVDIYLQPVGARPEVAVLGRPWLRAPSILSGSTR